MPIISLPGSPLSRSAEMRGSKYWIKRLDSVDTTKTDGYSFVGDFLATGASVELPAGTWVMDYYKDMSSSGKYCREQTVELFKVTEEGELASQGKFDLGGSGGWALRCRDEIAAMINAGPSADELRAERVKLTDRIAEIDKLLADS